MQSANPVLPAREFAPEALLPPRQAIVAFFSRVNVTPGPVERVALDDALGRVLAEPVVADDDYPNAARSTMDGFALLARAAPGAFHVSGDVRMGSAADASASADSATRIPTGGLLPAGTDTGTQLGGG